MSRRRKFLVADLLCGAGGSSTGCARALADLGLTMELVCVNHWGIAIETHKKNHPEARHYCQDISTVRPHLIVPEGYLDLLMASPTCFVAGTTVLTDRGPLPIEKISIGDRVLTHRGRWRPVINTMTRTAPTILLKGQGHLGFGVTPDHRFWSITRRGTRWTREFSAAEWTAAAEMPGKYWATPTYFPPMPIPSVEQRALPMDEGFWWIVGRWIGDGFLHLKPKNTEVVICCAHKEAAELKQRLAMHTPRVGRHRATDNELRWHSRTTMTVTKFITGHKYFAYWLIENFGRLAHEKTLPAWALGMPANHRRALLEGYVSADGHQDKRTTSIHTVSRKLAVGVRLLAESLGHRASMYARPARPGGVIAGRTIRGRDAYMVRWVSDPKRSIHHATDAHSWSLVESAALRDNDLVYDITIAEDHSFIADGIVVHNCTHHSVARGGKPTSDQQRSDPWHIVTWLTELRVKRMIIENVWEFIGWGPVDPRTGKPIKGRKGEYFRAWIETIRRLGFEPEWRKLNAADFGDATTRQRFILMARSDGRSVSWPIPTHRKREAGKLELFPSLSPWRPARDIIDWNIKGRSIFNRKKPLAPKTLARIYAGAVKFQWPEPFLVILRNHMAGQSVDGPLPTIAANGTHIGLAQPFILKQNFRRDSQSVDEPTPTVMTEARIGVAEPVIVRTDMHKSNARCIRSPDEPLATVTTRGGMAVAEPVIMNSRKGNQAKGVSTEPVPTLDTKGGVWLAEPFVMAPGSSGAPRETGEPLPTITTGAAGFEERPGCARPMLIEPFILSRQGGGAPRSTDEPTPTQCAKHSQVLISPYYGSGSGETCQSAEEPLPTVTSKGRFGMVVPITHSDTGNRARDVDTDPLPTVTTAHRGEIAFIVAQHGEREGQTPRVHDIGEPAPTVCATSHIDLVEATAQYDILFRMLEPHELAAAMGFSTEDVPYEFAGTKTEKIKQIGNAVSVAKMRACVAALASDAAQKRPAAPIARDKAVNE